MKSIYDPFVDYDEVSNSGKTKTEYCYYPHVYYLETYDGLDETAVHRVGAKWCAPAAHEELYTD